METRRAILTYHSLDESGSAISVRPEAFRRQMQALKSSGAPVVPLSELLSTPPPAVALTFDDGFQSFSDVAAPVLTLHGFPATVFLVTGFCGGRNDWPSQRPGIPLLPLMTWETIHRLSAAGVEFGAHTATHPDLAGLDQYRARDEILLSKRRIEDATGRPVCAFAYPYGSMTGGVREVVAQNFAAGCSTRLGWITPSSRPEALERLDVYYLSWDYLFRHVFGAASRCYLGLRAILRGWNT